MNFIRIISVLLILNIAFSCINEDRNNLETTTIDFNEYEIISIDTREVSF